MIYAGFCNGTNRSQSVVADGEVLTNWYVERIAAQFAPTGAALYPTPGQQSYIATADIGVRAIQSEVNGRAFAVIGTNLHEIFGTQTSTVRGVVTQDSYPATISYIRGANHLFITSGTNGYYYDLTTNILTQAAALNGIATMGGAINSRFLAFNTLTGSVRGSALNDGSSWPTNIAFTNSVTADPWIAMIIGTAEIILIGQQTGAIWVDTGAVPQPFAPASGGSFNYGIVAPFAFCKAGDQVTWVSKTDIGQGQVVSMRGSSPVLISNYAVDTAIAGYARSGGLADCEGLAYQQDGHTFGVFSFPMARGTQCVDLDTGDWHERGTWDSANNRYDAWKVRCHGYAFNKHLVGERGTGVISELDVNIGAENGNMIRRVRVGPPLWAKSGQMAQVSYFGLMLDAGLGLVSGQGVDPQVLMRASYDGRTWGPQRQCSAGPLGQYGRQVGFRRCGSSRKLWVPEIVVTDPTPWRIVGAEIEGDGLYQLEKAA